MPAVPSHTSSRYQTPARLSQQTVCAPMLGQSAWALRPSSTMLPRANGANRPRVKILFPKKANPPLDSGASGIRIGSNMKSTLPRLLALTIGAILLMSAYHRATSPQMMSGAANALLASLTPDQRAKATFQVSDDERLNWHFIP